jgi:t-SNARE complex subunit (syntaxin)
MSDSINNLMDDKDMYEQLTMEELFQEEIDHLQAHIDELDDEGLTEENQTKILKYRIVQEYFRARIDSLTGRISTDQSDSTLH